jgi:hypothetical protein
MTDPTTADVPTFEDDFDGPTLDLRKWLPHYLPGWSSRAESAATYEIRNSCLRLIIPPEQGLWCPDDHHPPLRVSAVQSGNWSGPVGSTRGQQPFKEGLTVRELQEPFWGWTPGPGRIDVRMRVDISARSMAAFFLIGREMEPRESAEVLLAEIFGKDVVAGESAEIGCGLRAFRDPTVTGDFATASVAVDVRDFHTFSLDWTAQRVTFSLDDTPYRTCEGPPTYPLQAMLTLYDFPEWSNDANAGHIPTLEIDYVRAYPN